MNSAKPTTTTSDLTWFKSSYSGTEGGQCVEVAAGTGVVHIRDSKTSTGPIVHVSREAWAGFIEAASPQRCA